MGKEGGGGQQGGGMRAEGWENEVRRIGGGGQEVGRSMADR